MRLIPVSLKEANAFVAEHHRHHKPVVGHKFSIGCMQAGRLVGVAIVGRPVSRYLDDGLTLEVNRLCTTGEKTFAVCSMELRHGRQKRSAIEKLLHTPWIPNREPVCGPLAGRAWGWQGENTGPEHASQPLISALRR